MGSFNQPAAFVAPNGSIFKNFSWRKAVDVRQKGDSFFWRKVFSEKETPENSQGKWTFTVNFTKRFWTFSNSSSQRQDLAVTASKKFFDFFQFCDGEAHQLWIQPEEVKISRKSLSYLHGIWCRFVISFEKDRQCWQSPLPKLKIETVYEKINKQCSLL